MRPVNKLYRMTERWIAENRPDLGAQPDLVFGRIMLALDRAGAGNLAEDAPLPLLDWPGESSSTREPAEIVKRKPMGIAQPDLEALARKIGGSR